MSEAPITDYSWEMNLTIRSLDKNDFVRYICSSENALGKAEGDVRLQGTHHLLADFRAIESFMAILKLALAMYF